MILPQLLFLFSPNVLKISPTFHIRSTARDILPNDVCVGNKCVPYLVATAKQNPESSARLQPSTKWFNHSWTTIEMVQSILLVGILQVPASPLPFHPHLTDYSPPQPKFLCWQPKVLLMYETWNCGRGQHISPISPMKSTLRFMSSYNVVWNC